MKKWLIVSLFCSASPAIFAQQATTPQEEWITIFVHGTVGRTVSIKYLRALFSKNIDGTRYKEETLKYRTGPTWARNQPAQKLGLHKIHMDTPIKNAAQLFARLYDEQQRKHYPRQKTVGYYTFGWSGLVNAHERRVEAEKFYKELKELVHQIRQLHPNIKIRIVGYSHGANVTLNMACLHYKDSQANFVVDEFISIAAPTQRETDCYIVYPFFKKAYVLYSCADCIQKWDIFSTKSFRSGRKFRDNARCTIESCIRQAEFRISMASCNDLKRCARCPVMHPHKRIKRSPGHIELWHFAKLCDCDGDGIYEPCFESKLYRYYFPLEPLPAAVFVPAVTATIDKHLPYRHSVIEMQPDTGKAVIRRKKSYSNQIIDFIPPATIEDMRTKSLPYLKKYTGFSPTHPNCPRCSRFS